MKNVVQTASTPALRAGSLLLIAGIVLMASNMRAAITAVGPLIGEINGDMGLHGSAVGLLTALPLIAFAVLSPIAPRVARRYGMENALFTSLLVLLAGILLRSAPPVIALFAGTLAVGAGIAMINVILPALIKRDYAARIGLMTGLYSMAMNGWAAAASGLSVPLSDGLSLGWRKTLLLWAVLALIAIVAWLPRLRGKKAPVSVQGEQTGPLWKSRLAWLVTLFMGLQSFTFYSSVAWLPQILQERGMDATSAGWMLSIMQFVSIPASFFVPFMAGKRPGQSGLAVASATASLIGYAGLAIGGDDLLMVWIVMLGIGSGASISLALSLFALRTRTTLQAARLSGMAQSLGYLLAAVGPVLIGYLYDATHSWTVPLIILVSATVCFLLIGIGAGRRGYIETTDRR